MNQFHENSATPITDTRSAGQKPRNPSRLKAKKTP